MIIPDLNLIKEYFRYDEESGLLYWRKSPGSSVRTGKVAGNLEPNGYIRVYFRGNKYLAQHIIWYIYYGVWPSQKTDHKNRVRNDNKIKNLRLSNSSQNSANSNWGPSKGVQYVHQTNKYRARIKFEGKLIHLGYFRSFEEAKEAYTDKAVELFGDFAYVL